MNRQAITALSEKLDTAWRSRVAIPPLSQTDPDLDIATAYAVQTAWTDMRLQRGEKIAGRKIGLTSQAIREQLKVSEPDYGTLWQSSFFEARNGSVEIDAGQFMQPRIEGEIAFLIGKPLEGSNITAEQVITATDACALGVEIVDSRIADWKIRLVDTIADNASYGGFTLGPWSKAMRDSDLAVLAMQISRNGEHAADGVGAAALGHPATSTAWLADKLMEFGVSLQPGDIVISGGITRMLPIVAGDRFLFALTGQPELAVSFT